MAKVFISYRREDSAGEARTLYKDLVENLGKESVFMDVDNIALGLDFRQILDECLESCEIVLVLIGKDWLNTTSEFGRRLDDPGDFVRQEIAAALKRDIPVAPVLLQDTEMPTAERLPDELKDFAFRNGFELRHARWESDVQEMIRRLGLTKGKRMETGDTNKTEIEYSQAGAADTDDGEAAVENSTIETPNTGSENTAVPESKKVSRFAILGVLAILAIGLLYFWTDEPPSSTTSTDVSQKVTPNSANKGAEIFGGYYTLQSQFLEQENKCLEGSNGASGAFMDNCQNVTGQLWKFVPANDGYYQLKNMNFKEDKCLEGNHPEKGTASNGATFMDKCQDAAGQLWKLIPSKNGYYRLMVRALESENRCLESNKVAPSAYKNGAAYMDTCQNVTGQWWKITKMHD